MAWKKHKKGAKFVYNFTPMITVFSSNVVENGW